MASALTCYTVGLDFVTSSNQYFGCGSTASNTTLSSSNSTGHQACCYGGDYCMADGICHYTHDVQGGSGYYMAGCTDPTWQDPACPKQCTSEYGADVVYSGQGSQWNCCVSSEGNLDCDNPSNFNVSAPAPSSLSTIKQANIAVPSSAVLTPIGSISVANATVTAGNGTAVATLTASLNGTLTTSSSVRTTSSASSTGRSTITSTMVSNAATATTEPPSGASATSAESAPASSSSSAATANINPVRIGMAALMLLPAAMLGL